MYTYAVVGPCYIRGGRSAKVWQYMGSPLTNNLGASYTNIYLCVHWGLSIYLQYKMYPSENKQLEIFTIYLFLQRKSQLFQIKSIVSKEKCIKKAVPDVGSYVAMSTICCLFHQAVTNIFPIIFLNCFQHLYSKSTFWCVLRVCLKLIITIT